jgi:deoxynucleoside triphosphate triphosphohydrolase SAMHD1
VNCDIHGAFRLSSIALAIVDTPEFQRLRYIKQLGACYLVYPSATHTRFEHSLGVYHLAGQMIEHIRIKYPDRKFNVPVFGKEPVVITKLMAECVKIAGLCHDLGHGPFSHNFDSIVGNVASPCRYHEVRSCMITELICRRELSDTIDQLHIDFIKSLIDPGPNDTGAIYQIIANKLNGIDVDKFDYLARDSLKLGLKVEFDHSRLMNEFIVDQNDNIAFPKQCSIDVYSLFHSRYIMNRKVYLHKTGEIVARMIGDIFRLVDPILNFSSTIEDMNQFCQLNDNTIFERLVLLVNPPSYFVPVLQTDELVSLNQAYNLYQRIQKRHLYGMVREFLIEKPGDDAVVTTVLEELVKSGISKDHFYVVRRKAGYVGSDIINPFKNVFFYSHENDLISFVLKKKFFSLLINDQCNEEIVRIVYKGDDQKILSKARRKSILVQSIDLSLQ